MERVYWICTDCGARILLEFCQECPICAGIVDYVGDNSPEDGEWDE